MDTLATMCQIPGCTQPLAVPGVCDGCREAFGPMLRGDTPLTEQQVAIRDREVREALRMHHVIEEANQRRCGNARKTKTQSRRSTPAALQIDTEAEAKRQLAVGDLAVNHHLNASAIAERLGVDPQLVQADLRDMEITS